MKTLVIDAIVGVGFPTLTLALSAEKSHMATYIGGQFNAKHQWNRAKLEELTLETLKTIYEGLRSEREIQEAEPVAVAQTTVEKPRLHVVGGTYAC